MANVATVLKDEITRLARKELRKAVDPIRKLLAIQRREIVALKRDRLILLREVKALAKGKGREVTAPAEEPAARVRFSPAGLKTLRARLGISAAAFGSLVGVSGQTIYHWENEKAQPRKAQLPRIAALRGVGKKDVQGLLDAAAKAKGPAKKARKKLAKR